MICDIDGTLADASHRLHLLPGPGAIEEDWSRFMAPELVVLDKPILVVWDIVAALLDRDYDVAFITGRRNSLRGVTHDWLIHQARGYHMQEAIEEAPLLMRPDGDHRKSHEIKREHLVALRASGRKPTIAFEDRAEDTAMYRAEGLRVFQVAEGFY